ncbi:MAG: hypothetical protein Q6358_06670 [Candidatus Brocadiales bacterium]|nr:hypothetical protein [Candidatus Brocadiales bacterium]
MSSEDIPGELIDTLPLEFQLAQYTGHLWCYRDDAGETNILTIWNSVQRSKWSKGFSDKLNSALADDQYRVSTPLGYPQIFCVMPNVDVEQLFDETWFGSWLTYLTTWEANEVENENLNVTNRKLAVDISDLSKLIIQIDESIKNYEKQIQGTQSAIDEIDVLINQRKSRLAMMIPGLEPRQEKELPPFDQKIRYDKDKDPFVSVIKDGTIDLSGKPWASDQMSGGKYLDAELAQKIDEVNDAFSNPDKLNDKALQQDIRNLKENGFQGITVTSGARTPWRQADLYANAKKNNNPVGKYVRSDHMFGQAADMSIPEGWSWNSDIHKNLRSVMRRLGVKMGVPEDRVHFTLVSPSRSFYARRLAMVRAYLSRASQIKSAQGAVRENVIFEKTKLLEQKVKVEADLQARNNELTKTADIFTRISATYLSKQRELQQLDAEIARREDEARRRAEEEDRRRAEKRGSSGGGEGREPGHFHERPEPRSPKVGEPQPQHSEPPRKEPPQRREPPMREPPQGDVEIGGKP